MRSILIFALFFAPSVLFADVFHATSVLKTVKVFPSAAGYERVVSVDLPAGSHQIVVSGLPQSLNVGSMQAKLSTGIIQAVEFRTQRQAFDPLPKPIAQLDAEKLLDTARANLARLKADRSVMQGKITSAATRIKYLQSLVGFNGDDATPTGDALAVFVDTIGTKIAAATSDLTAAQGALAKTARALAEAQKEEQRLDAALNAVTPLVRETGTVVIDVHVPKAGIGVLALQYLNADASWQPSYDVLVNQDKATATIEVVRNAIVYQESGEDWQNVDVTLSTAQLNRQTQVYVPRSDIRTLYVPRPVQKMRTEYLAEADMKMGSMAEPIVAMFSGPVAVLKGQTLEFALGVVREIRGDQTPKLIRLGSFEVKSDLRAETDVANDTSAYLYADLKNETGGTILSGEARLFRDGVFVGMVQMPEIPNGDTIDLALGNLNGILVERRIVQVQEGDTGLIKSYNQKIEQYEVTLRSLLDYPINLVAYAALPVSEAEDLKVTLDVTPKPSETDIEGRRGVVSWTLDMKPQSEQKISYGWTLKWPENKLIDRR